MLSSSDEDESDHCNQNAAGIASSKPPAKRKAELFSIKQEEPKRQNTSETNSTNDDDAKPPARRVSPELNEEEVVLLDDNDESAGTANDVGDQGKDNDEDRDMAAAIAASLKDVSTTAPTTSTRGISSSQPQVPKVPLPSKVWMNQDKGAISSGILRNIQTSKGNYGVTTSTTLNHIQQPDKWSCGFRNLQMVLSALVPTLPSSHPYFGSLGHIYEQLPADSMASSSSSPLLVLPSLYQLQEQLENCWREGFDSKGAEHFQHQVVGKKSQIGAVEVGFLLRYWSVDSCVIQFIKCKQSRELLPAVVYRYFQQANRLKESVLDTAAACVEWAEQERESGVQKDYRISLSSSKTTARGDDATISMPLYLQWEGHSVTVVGVEPTMGGGAVNWKRWNLLVLDPFKRGTHYGTSANSTSTEQRLQPFRLPCRELAQKDVQLVMVGHDPMTKEQRDLNKDTTHAVTADNTTVMSKMDIQYE